MKALLGLGFVCLLLTACTKDPATQSATEEVRCSNQPATVCCKNMFPPGMDRGQCISAAARGFGPCATCRADAAVPDAAEVDAAEIDGSIDATVP